MKKIIVSLLLFHQSILLAQNEESRIVFVEIDGEEQSVVLNKQSTLHIDGKDYPVTIRMNPYADFKQAHLQFSHPSNYHVSFEKMNFLAKLWNIEGNNTMIMVQDYGMLMGEQEYLQMLKDEFKSMKAEIKESTSVLETQSAVLKGRKLLIKLGNISLHQEVYIFPRKTQMSILIIQDMLSDNGEHSQEYQVVKKLLAKTLVVK